MKISRHLAAFAGAAVLLGLPAVASADFSLDFSVIVTGDTPGGTGPWATLDVSDTGVDEVTMTLTHNASSAAGQFITALWLNYDGTLPGDIDVNSADASFEGWGFGGTNAGLIFDLDVEIENSGGGDRLLPGESITFVITGTGLFADGFNTLSGASGENDPVLAMIHIQGIAGDGEGSSKLAPVPEPATMAVLGLGALGLMRRRRKS